MADNRDKRDDDERFRFTNNHNSTSSDTLKVLNSNSDDEQTEINVPPDVAEAVPLSTSFEPEKRRGKMVEITTNGTYRSSLSSSTDRTDMKPNSGSFAAEDRSKFELENDIKTFDDVLPYVGDFGRYQWFLLLALAPYSIVYACLYFGQIFLTLVPTEHWCYVEDSDNFTIGDRMSRTIPSTSEYPYYDTCHQWNLTQRNASPNSPVDTIPCTKWEYNTSIVPYISIAAELDWVCDRSYLVSLSQSIFFCGSILGGLIFGWTADHKGRIPSLVVCLGIGLISSIAVPHTTTFWSFVVARFFAGLAYDTCLTLPLITVLEYTAVHRRSIVVNVAFGIYFAITSTVIPWVAYYIANWRIYAYVLAIPMLSSIATPWILPESARWQLANGMSDKVTAKLKRIAEVNGKDPNPEVYKILIRNTVDTTKQGESATLLDIFKKPRLTRTFILLTIAYIFMTLVFDGHVYSLKMLHGSVFVSFSLACLTELPAGFLLAVILDRWGRRLCCFGTMALTTVCSFLIVFFQEGTLSLVFAIAARFALNMAANVLLQFGPELLPTTVRAQGFAFVHIIGIVAHSVAPYIIELGTIWTGLPMVVLGCMAIVTCLLVLFLPETMGKDMPQTLEDGERFGADDHFWTFPCCNKSSST